MKNKILTIILCILTITYGLFISIESFSVLTNFPIPKDFKTPIGGIMVWHYPCLVSMDNSARQIANVFVLVIGIVYMLLGLGLLKRKLYIDIPLLFLIFVDFIYWSSNRVIACFIRKGEWDYLFRVMQSPYIIAGVLFLILFTLRFIKIKGEK